MSLNLSCLEFVALRGRAHHRFREVWKFPVVIHYPSSNRLSVLFSPLSPDACLLTSPCPMMPTGF